jgi:hypothetical protein
VRCLNINVTRFTTLANGHEHFELFPYDPIFILLQVQLEVMNFCSFENSEWYSSNDHTAQQSYYALLAADSTIHICQGVSSNDMDKGHKGRIIATMHLVSTKTSLPWLTANSMWHYNRGFECFKSTPPSHN